MLTVVSQGLPHLFMETFVAIFPDLTNRPWVSEDEEELGKLISDAVPEETKRHLKAFTCIYQMIYHQQYLHSGFM